MKHPAILQIRGNANEGDVKRIVEKYCKEYDFQRIGDGIDVHVSDVNEARNAISRLKKMLKSRFDIKMSTKYAGLRNGKVRVLFVYSIRIKNKNSR